MNAKKRISVLAATLFLVATFVTPATALAAPPAQGEVTYIVKPGDNLWTLAEKYLGSGPAYTAIVAATNAKHEEDSSFAYIESAGRIQAGWKLLIPGTGATTTTVAGSWTPAGKCQWLRANFPQTAAGVQDYLAKLANVPVQRVASHLYPCSPTETAYDGAIVLGPSEGFWNTVFSVNVPNGGAVDTYPGATCTGSSRRIGTETIRCVSGTVTALRVTYWPWNDDAPPISVTSTVTTATTACENPQALATRMGWKVIEWADAKYGGLRVELTTGGQLASLWEAISSGKTIKETDTDRSMPAGVYTIYPPFACREELGFSK